MDVRESGGGRASENGRGRGGEEGGGDQSEPTERAGVLVHGGVREGGDPSPPGGRLRAPAGILRSVRPGRMPVREGDRILFGKYSGSEVTLNSEEYLIMKEEDVLGILGS